MGASMTPGKRSGGQWSPIDERYVEGAQRIGSPGVATTSWSVGQSRTAAHLGRRRAADQLRPVRSATTAESIAWSKWVWTGSTASSRSTPRRARQPSMRGSDGVSLPRPDGEKAGREKNPSVISADSPSSISRVVTPAHVTVSGDRASRRLVEVPTVVRRGPAGRA